jgi:hypothetical protein
MVASLRGREHGRRGTFTVQRLRFAVVGSEKLVAEI